MKRTPEELEAIVKTLSDRAGLTNDVISGKLEICFRCSSSGLYYPADYLKEWGRKYGYGLGQEVVSECLETIWQAPPAKPKNMISPTQIMYPVGHHRAQVDAYIMKAEDYKTLVKGNEIIHAITMQEDPNIVLRSRIIREKQLKNKNGLLRSVVGNLDKYM